MIKHYGVIVIGGGASGMMAAIAAAEYGASVVLIEKNKRLGEKLRITGGGRCNITNAELDVRVLLKNYGAAEKFLYSAFTTFGIKDTIEFFENIKLPIQVEDRKRAFPISEKAVDVVHVMQNRLHRLGVKLLLNTAVTSINTVNGKIEGVSCDDIIYTANSYVFATGGTSRPETGSTGDGFGWLKKLGHTTKTPTPTITPLALRDQWVSRVAGVTAKDAGITFYCNGAKAFKLRGDILFTHFGISGPLILNNAYKVADILQAGDVTALLDFFPDINPKLLDQQIINVLNANGTKLLKNTLTMFAPKGLTPALLLQLHTAINFETKNSEVTKPMREKLVQTLKAMSISIEKLMGFEKAVVADGGVELKEIDMRTMRSKKVSNLFITGDLLNINRPSGGYSLQLCWTTGYIAGTHAAQK
jgi:hypothetical protein